MLTRRSGTVSKIPPRTTHRGTDPQELPLLWRFRHAWFDLRCGKPTVVEHTEGLPPFVLIPSVAGGDAAGNLQEIECDMVCVLGYEETATRMGRMVVTACPTKSKQRWIVMVEPDHLISGEWRGVCQRFCFRFDAALRLDTSLH